MQISRLFEIVYILLNRRQITARELAERFEVSVRTIYRDIDALSQAGVPVYAVQGSGGGIRISDQYVLNKSALTDDEQSQILIALKSLTATGNPESDHLLSRLGNLFQKESNDWIEVDFSRWGSFHNDRQALSTLKEAILSHRTITFTYFSSYGIESQRTVYPIKLVYKGRSWYVQAYCVDKKDYRTFKLVRMIDICLLNEGFDAIALPPLPPLESGNNASEKHFDCTPLHLRFEPTIAWRVYDEFEPSQVERMDDGSLSVHVCFPIDEWLYGYLLSFGTALEVISPPSLRRELRSIAKAICDKYSET